MSNKPKRATRLLQRVRHARHPLRGWRRWAVIAGQGLAGFVALFAVVNLTLSLSANNIFDGDARRASSVLKDFAPLAGRDIRLTLKVAL